MDGGGEIENIKRWIVFYPIYINSKKTVAEGRRISLANACENPTFTEIADCCAHLKLPNAIELDKAYPRDFMQRGRVRVLLKREDGTLCNPAISSRCWPSISAGGDLKMFYDGRNTKDSCLEVVYRMYWLCYHIHTYKKTQLVEILINKVETSVRFPPTLRAFTCSVSAWLKRLRDIALKEEMKIHDADIGTTLTLLGLTSSLSRFVLVKPHQS